MQRLDIQFADLFPPVDTHRSPGLHLSEVVKDLVARVDPRYRTLNGAKAEPSLRMEVGNVVEDLIGDAFANRLSRLHAAHVVRLGEIERDGVIGTPDFGLISTPPGWGLPEDGQAALVECKATWISTRHLRSGPEDAWTYGDIDIPKFKYHVWQLKSYCAMAGITRGVLIPVFMNGDYTFQPPHGGPQCVPYYEDWTARELEEHWEMVSQHAARMRAKGVVH